MSKAQAKLEHNPATPTDVAEKTDEVRGALLEYLDTLGPDEELDDHSIHARIDGRVFGFHTYEVIDDGHEFEAHRGLLSDFIKTGSIADFRGVPEMIAEDQTFYACDNETHMHETLAAWFDGCDPSELDQLVDDAETRYHAMVFDLRSEGVNIEYRGSHSDWVPRRNPDIQCEGFGLITTDDEEQTTDYGTVAAALAAFWKKGESK